MMGRTIIACLQLFRSIHFRAINDTVKFAGNIPCSHGLFRQLTSSGMEKKIATMSKGSHCMNDDTYFGSVNVSHKLRLDSCDQLSNGDVFFVEDDVDILRPVCEHGRVKLLGHYVLKVGITSPSLGRGPTEH